MRITLEIKPVPLGRPRVNTTNRGRYLPKSSKEFREQFQWLLLNEKKFLKPYTKPLKITMHFYKPVKATSKTRYGDIDNLAKAVLDACNGILFIDDSQIVEMHCYKHKGADKIEIEVVENVD